MFIELTFTSTEPSMLGIYEIDRRLPTREIHKDWMTVRKLYDLNTIAPNGFSTGILVLFLKVLEIELMSN